MTTQNKNICYNCGNVLPLRGNFCPHCHTPINKRHTIPFHPSNSPTNFKDPSSMRRPPNPVPTYKNHSPVFYHGKTQPPPQQQKYGKNIPPPNVPPIEKDKIRFRSKVNRKIDPFEGSIIESKYRIIEKIGEGGMAYIYKAEHLHLKEIRAIKIIKRNDGRKSQYGRFLREARLTRKVCFLTPHIVRVDDFGYDVQKKVYYFSMEYLKGKSLREILRIPPYRLSPQKTVRIAVQVCEAMEISHRQGIIHRDLKPDNIFLCEFQGQKEFVKIIDYGLAKPLNPEEPNYTEVGKVVGTPEYMSPEQCRGPSPEERLKGISHIDGRADIYSLGIILYQCLAGRVPFALEGEPTPQNFLKLMSRQISEKPKPLSQIRNDIPKPLIDVIDKALSKNPNDRFSSMFEMQKALIEAVPNAFSSSSYPFSSESYNSIISYSDIFKDSVSSYSLEPFQIQIDPELPIN